MDYCTAVPNDRSGARWSTYCIDVVLIEQLISVYKIIRTKDRKRTERILIGVSLDCN